MTLPPPAEWLAPIAVVLLVLTLHLARRLRHKLRDLEVGKRRLEAEVAERKRSEEQLRALEGRFREVAQSANDAIISADPQGRIVFWNRGARSIFGWTEREALGMPVVALLAEPYRPGYGDQLERMQKMNATRVMGEVYECRGVRKSGEEFPLDMTLARWWAAGGVHITSVIRDMTQRKRAEEALARQAQTLVRQARELERSNAELEQFASVVSHDLREPLRKMSGYGELLAERYRGRLDPRADKYLGYLVDGAQRMQRMMDELLGYCRAGQGELRPRPTELMEVMERVKSNLEVAMCEAGAEVTWDPLPRVSADPSEMERLLQNLVANAIKFHGSEAPRVHVSAVRDGESWKLSVKDNGIGIDPRDADELFVPFRRLHARAEVPGTGLGLAVCKKIVERHGGRIWVESEPGRGATFLFRLPETAPASSRSLAPARGT